MSITLIEAIAAAYNSYIRPQMKRDEPADTAAIKDLLRAAGWVERERLREAEDEIHRLTGLLAARPQGLSDTEASNDVG